MTDTSSEPTDSRRVNISDYWNDRAALALSAARDPARDTSQLTTITGLVESEVYSVTSATPVSVSGSLIEAQQSEPPSTSKTSPDSGSKKNDKKPTR